MASALAFMSLSVNAFALDSSASADAGPLGANAAAATGINADTETEDATDSAPSTYTYSDGAYGTGGETDGYAAAGSSGILNNGRGNGFNADKGLDGALNISEQTLTNANILAEATADAEVVMGGGDPVSVYSSYAGAAVAEARSSIENKTINQSVGDEITLVSDSQADANVTVYAYDYNANEDPYYNEAQAAAASAAASFSSSSIKNNIINHSGTINNESDNGILLHSKSEANSDAYANATAFVEDVFTNDANDSNDNDDVPGDVDASAATESYAESIIENNTVNNTGTIVATDAAIALVAESDAFSEATYELNPFSITDLEYVPNVGDSDSWAVSKIIGNTINNTGSLNADTGILLNSYAYADDNENAYSNHAESWVNGNFITNHGTINATNSGMLLHAESIIDNDGIGISTSKLNDNILTNIGTILVGNGAGVELLAESSGGDEAYTYMQGNTITNSGTISANGRAYTTIDGEDGDSSVDFDGGKAGRGADGIRLRAEAFELNGRYTNDDAAEISDNKINNTGRIYALDDGIEISASDGREGWSFFGYRDLRDAEDNSLIVNNEINNTYGGRIVAGDVGINISADYVQRNTINNSGLIVSDPGMSLNGANLTKSDRALWDANNANAIRFAGWADNSFNTNNVEPEGTQNFLNLNAPGYLAGRIMLRQESDVNVSLTSGVSHSVRWAIQNENGYAQEDQGSDINNPYTWSGGTTTKAVLGGPNPWFVNERALIDGEPNLDVNGRVNDVYATIDPSAFSAAANMLADLSGMVSTMAKTGMNQTGEKNGVWIAANGTRMDYDGDKRATMDQDTRVMGGSIGYTHHFDGFKAGVMAGYSDAELQVGSFYRDLYKHSYDNDTRGGFAGVYGNTDIGWLNVNVGLSGGRLNHDDKRFVNDNLKWWGISYAKADYDSTWYSPEVTLSVPFEAGEGFTITPNLHLQYTKQNIDSYTEKGSDSNARVASRDIAVSEVKAGLDVSKTVGMARFMGRVGYLNRNSHGDNSVRVTMIGDTQDVPFFYQDINAVYVGAGVNINLGDRVDFNLSGNYLTGKDFDNGGNVAGMLRFKY